MPLPVWFPSGARFGNPIAFFLSRTTNTLSNQQLEWFVPTMSTTAPQYCPGRLWIARGPGPPRSTSSTRTPVFALPNRPDVQNAVPALSHGPDPGTQTIGKRVGWHRFPSGFPPGAWHGNMTAHFLSRPHNTLSNQQLKLFVLAMSTTHPQHCPDSLWIARVGTPRSVSGLRKHTLPRCTVAVASLRVPRKRCLASTPTRHARATRAATRAVQPAWS